MLNSNLPSAPLMDRHTIQWITVHCSATHSDQDVGAAEIRHWHQQRGWRDIGYHWVIRRNGNIETGRPITQTGAHVSGANHGNVGICMIGGCDKQQQPQDNFTLAQRKALFRLIEDLQRELSIHDDHVRPHNYWSDKACPVIELNGEHGRQQQ